MNYHGWRAGAHERSVAQVRSEPAGPTHPGPILLCAGTDAACAARLAIATAMLLADRPVVVLATWEPPPLHGTADAVMDALYDTHADVRAAARMRAAAAAEAACDVLEAHGIDAAARICTHEQSPWQTILALAERLDAAVIVAGVSNERAPPARSLGRQARALAHRSVRPLLLLPTDRGFDGHGEAAPAIFAYDGSPAAGHAIAEAAALLRPRDAIVANAWQRVSAIIGVARADGRDDAAHEGAPGLDLAARLEAEEEAVAGVALLAAAGWPSQAAALETAGNAPRAIVAGAGECEAAVVVTGTRGRSRIAAALLGSTAEAIVRHAGRPVLLVPPAA